MDVACSATIKEISNCMAQLVSLTQSDPDLGKECMRFEAEHATARAQYEEEPGNDGDGGGVTAPLPERALAQLHSALERMADFALSCARVALRRGSSCSPFSCDPTSVNAPHPVEAARSSSAEEFNCGTTATERNASIMHYALQVAVLVLVAHEPFRQQLQNTMVDSLHILEYVVEALELDRTLELSRFAEGYRTSHMNLLANLTYRNNAVCCTVATHDPLMHAIISNTFLDEANPGLAEWSDFVLRNVCVYCQEGRDCIAALRAASRGGYGGRGKKPV